MTVSRSTRRLRVLMAGPLPPLIGGMTTVIDDLSKSELADAVDLRLFDTKKVTPEKRSLRQGVAARFALWRRWWTALADVDIAHIHTCSGLSYFLDSSLLLLGRLRGVPVIMHVHGARFDTFLDSLSPPLAYAAAWLARRAARVIVLSGEWREKLSTRLHGARLAIVENGIAVPEQYRADPGREGAVTVLFLGNLGERKGVWEIASAAEGLDPQVRIVLVGGEEDPGITGRLRERLAERGLAEVVSLPGPAVGDAKYRMLAQAQVFTLPSHAEGLPMALLEAMAVGLPPVVTPVGAIPSVITEGVTGLLVPPNDPAALRGALNQLARDPALRARMGAAARRVCLDRYGLQQTARKILGVYEDVIRPIIGDHRGEPTAERHARP